MFAAYQEVINKSNSERINWFCSLILLVTARSEDKAAGILWSRP